MKMAENGDIFRPTGGAARIGTTTGTLDRTHHGKKFLLTFLRRRKMKSGNALLARTSAPGAALDHDRGSLIPIMASNALPQSVIHAFRTPGSIHHAPGRSSYFVITCDDSILRWLAQSFRNLRNRGSFRLGDGSPIGSDGKCAITFVPGKSEAVKALGPSATGQFRWLLSDQKARRYASLIDAMASLPSCHQYLEAEEPLGALVVVSKGEYDIEALRRMRDAHP
jgi:hypothetical protein